ncbi:MAG: hypothetical protein ACREIS_05855 [Nitrospiraceae bacterium]
MIQNDDQLHHAEADIQKLWKFLEHARQTHAPAEYELLARPYLLQIQERQQEILHYLSSRPEAIRTY